ncbi:MAG: hypothetical protein ATN36_00630 [Epulopiscium sp. Nele67-Bin005]|nr:MAG: hypothetical protein ATN36_00630 [Epulopiscium sp. Nele67-Bin005]
MSKNFRQQINLAVGVAVSASTLPVYATPLFSDIDKHWAEETIKNFADKGIIQGYADGTFKPNESLTRAELAIAINNIFKIQDVENAVQYDDVASGAWYSDAIDAVSATKVMNDYGNKFYPNELATREEVIYALVQVYNLTHEHTKLGFSDAYQISNWAQEAVETLVAHGYLEGRPDGTLGIQDNITRAEIVTLFNRLSSEIISMKGVYSIDTDWNVVINAPDTILKNSHIKGNLYITQGVADGDVLLQNVTVDGTVFIEGGGENSIYLENSTLNKVVVDKYDNKICIHGDIDTTIGVLECLSWANIEGKMKLGHLVTSSSIIIQSTVDLDTDNMAITSTVSTIAYGNATYKLVNGEVVKVVSSSSGNSSSSSGSGNSSNKPPNIAPSVSIPLPDFGIEGEIVDQGVVVPLPDFGEGKVDQELVTPLPNFGIEGEIDQELVIPLPNLGEGEVEIDQEAVTPLPNFGIEGEVERDQEAVAPLPNFGIEGEVERDQELVTSIPDFEEEIVADTDFREESIEKEVVIPIPDFEEEIIPDIDFREESIEKEVVIPIPDFEEEIIPDIDFREESIEKEVVIPLPDFEEEIIPDIDFREESIEKEVVIPLPDFEEEIIPDIDFREESIEKEVVIPLPDFEEEIVPDIDFREESIEKEVGIPLPDFEEEIVPDIDFREESIEKEVVTSLPDFEEEIIPDIDFREESIEKEVVIPLPDFEEEIVADTDFREKEVVIPLTNFEEKIIPVETPTP